MIKRVSFLPKQVTKKYQVVTTRFIDPSDMIDFCNTSFKSQVLYQTKTEFDLYWQIRFHGYQNFGYITYHIFYFKNKAEANWFMLRYSQGIVNGYNT